jgi:hypothetical protein
MFIHLLYLDTNDQHSTIHSSSYLLLNTNDQQSDLHLSSGLPVVESSHGLPVVLTLTWMVTWASGDPSL